MRSGNLGPYTQIINSPPGFKNFINDFVNESNVNINDRNEVILGVRPEDIEVSHDGNIKGEVYSIELTGDSTYVAIELGEDLLIAKTKNEYKTSIGSPISFRMNRNKTYFFDSESENRIIE